MDTRSLLRACFLALLAGSVNGETPTDDVQPVEELRRFAESYLLQHLQAPAEGNATVHVAASQIDSRLRRDRCTAPLQGLLPAGNQISARVTLGVRCASPEWTVYVPITIETELRILVLRTAVARNSSLTAADVELQQRRVRGIATQYLTSPEQLRGRHLKVAAGAGSPLAAEMLAADILIRRGQRVTLVANAGGIEVQAQGEAISDANAAGRVRVKNLSSLKVVEGQAETSDRVRVSL